ncbi:hypothetical protein ACM0P9_02380 [Streptococcus pluranimalium]
MDYVYIIFIVGISLVIYAVYQATKSMLFVSKTYGYNYLIRFQKIEDIPDLKANKRFYRKFRVVSHSSKGVYTVQSRWSDQELKENIIKEYRLNDNQVTVQSLQISGPLGMV